VPAAIEGYTRALQRERVGEWGWGPTRRKKVDGMLRIALTGGIATGKSYVLEQFRKRGVPCLDADELVHGGKTGRLVSGYRGAPAADADSLKDLLHRLSRLGEDLPEVAELDLNPVLGQPAGCIAVDARARVRRPEVVSRAKTW